MKPLMNPCAEPAASWASAGAEEVATKIATAARPLNLSRAIASISRWLLTSLQPPAPHSLVPERGLRMRATSTVATGLHPFGGLQCMDVEQPISRNHYMTSWTHKAASRALSEQGPKALPIPVRTATRATVIMLTFAWMQTPQAQARPEEGTFRRHFRRACRGRCRGLGRSRAPAGQCRRG